MLLVAIAGCGGGAGDEREAAAPLAETCRVTLARREGQVASGAGGPAATTIEGRPSRLVAFVDLPLAPIAKDLEATVPSRLAEERNRNIGIAGHLNYTVDRGPFSLAVEGDALVVRTDVRARAEACRGGSCYASCEPQGQATATVPLRLGPDYRFAPSRVSFTFRRGCEVRAMGGLVKIDVTPSIQSELAPALRRVERQIDQRLPPMRPQAERLWAELNKTRPLPLGGCVVTNPRGLVQGPISGKPGGVSAGFGLVAYPEIRTRCGDAPAPRALPPLAQEPRMPASDELLVGLVSPLAAFGGSLASTEPFDAGGARTRAGRVLASSASPHAVLDVSLRGEACGDLAVRTSFEWTPDGRALRPASPALLPGERERAVASSLAPDALLRGLSTTMRAPPPIPVDSLRELVPTVAQGLSDPTVDVRATVDDAKPSSVVVRGEDVVALVAVRGTVHLAQK